MSEIEMDRTLRVLLHTYLGTRAAYYSQLAAAQDQAAARNEIELGVEDSYSNKPVVVAPYLVAYDGAREELTAGMLLHGLGAKVDKLISYHSTDAGHTGVDVGREFLQALGVSDTELATYQLV